MDWFEDCINLYVRLVRNPIGIDFPNDKIPETQINTIQEIVQVGDLDYITHKHPEENIWRSWQVFTDNLCLNSVSRVPICIDIDNEEHNLEAAYNLTRDCLNLLERMKYFPQPDRIRVVFSGRKGFHIEAKPVEPVDNLLIRKSLLSGLNKLGQENTKNRNCFSNGVIDLNHDFVRVTGSFYSWQEGDNFIKRKVFQMSTEDFRRANAQDILENSKPG